jgi:hypothetical protein
MRSSIQRTEQKIINRAAQVAQNRAGQRALGGASFMPAPVVTREGEDEDGNVITIHDFMLNEDTLGGVEAELRVGGHFYDYGN